MRYGIPGDFGTRPGTIEVVAYGCAPPDSLPWPPDIGLRMLEPHELLRAQFGRFAASYDLSRAPTKAAKVRLIGNSVCPEVAEALVRANLRGVRERRAA